MDVEKLKLNREKRLKSIYIKQQQEANAIRKATRLNALAIGALVVGVYYYSTTRFRAERENIARLLAGDVITDEKKD